MELIVNGQPQTFDGPPMTVRQLVEKLGMGRAPVAVELNRQVIPRARHEQTLLKDGDQLELVSLVGGG